MAAEDLDDRVCLFEELSPEAQNLTRSAHEDELPTSSPIPPEFAAAE